MAAANYATGLTKQPFLNIMYKVLNFTHAWHYRIFISTVLPAFSGGARTVGPEAVFLVLQIRMPIIQELIELEQSLSTFWKA